MTSIRKLGLLTCWPGCQITPPIKSPTCFPGIGSRTARPRPPLLPERFAADHRACLGCWPDPYRHHALCLGASEEEPWGQSIAVSSCLNSLRLAKGGFKSCRGLLLQKNRYPFPFS